MWDVFISYASEDRPLAQELADALEEEGLKVWYDETVLKLGDSLRRSIDRGLAESRYGLVILSPAFFAKSWTQYELDGLVTRDLVTKTILPVWHNVDRKLVARYSPTLADRVAVSTEHGLDKVVDKIMEVVRPEKRPPGEAVAVSFSLNKGGREAPDPRQLQSQLTRLFNAEELRTLCFELNVDYDDLAGESKSGKARELVTYLNRRGRLAELPTLISKLRPHAAPSIEPPD